MSAASVSKRAAQLTGAVKYEGGPCRTCGGTVRYTRNSTCATCTGRADHAAKWAHARARDEANGRAEAVRLGHKVFTDKTGPCHCGCVVRYAANNRCTKCHRASMRKASARRRALARAKREG